MSSRTIDTYFSTATASSANPLTMSASNEPEKLELNGMTAYVVVTHGHFGTDYQDIVNISGVYVDIKDAVSALKKQRLIVAEKNEYSGWLSAPDSESRDKYPCRNKIGRLWQYDSGEPRFIGWGYSWPSPDGGEGTDRVYLEKTNIWRGSSKVRGELRLNREDIEVLEAQSDIEYVAGDVYVPENARFDEETNDLIYSSEEESDSHEVEAELEARDTGALEVDVMDWISNVESSE
jgi:hypothetical protein